MHYELTLDELLIFNDTYYIQDCASVSFKMGDVAKHLPILKGPLRSYLRYYDSKYYSSLFASNATYILQNKVTQQYYFGSAGDVYRRISFHKEAIRFKKHNNRNIKKLSEKYDDRFYDLALIFTSDRDEAYDIEDYLIKLYWGTPKILNLAEDARSSGGNMSPETRALKSKLMLSDENVAIGRERIKHINSNPVFVANRNSGISKALGIEVMAYGVLYPSHLSAASALGISKGKFNKLLKNVSIPEVYVIGKKVGHRRGIKPSEETRKLLSNNIKNSKIHAEKMRTMNRPNRIRISINGREHNSVNEASRAEGRSVSTINEYMRKTLPNPGGKYILIMPETPSSIKYSISLHCDTTYADRGGKYQDQPAMPVVAR